MSKKRQIKQYYRLTMLTYLKDNQAKYPGLSGIEWVSAGCRQGVGRVSNFGQKCVKSVQVLHNYHKNATLAIPLRHPCDGGGVAAISYMYQWL